MDQEHLMTLPWSLQKGLRALTENHNLICGKDVCRNVRISSDMREQDRGVSSSNTEEGSAYEDSGSSSYRPCKGSGLHKGGPRRNERDKIVQMFSQVEAQLGV